MKSFLGIVVLPLFLFCLTWGVAYTSGRNSVIEKHNIKQETKKKINCGCDGSGLASFGCKCKDCNCDLHIVN